MKIVDTPIINIIPTWPNFLVRGLTLNMGDPKYADPIRKVHIDTYVRVQCEGVWYFTQAAEIYEFDPRLNDPEMMLEQALQRLCSSVYYIQHLGVVDPSIKMQDGRPAFMVDPDQRSEAARLRGEMKNL